MSASEVSRNLGESVKQAFSDTRVQEHSDEFLSTIRSAMQESEKSVRRNAAYMLLLVFLFELIGRGGVGELSLGFAKVTDSNVFRGLIPLAVAYLYSEMLGAFSDYFNLYTVYEGVIETVYKPISDNYLIELLIPTSSLTHGAARGAFFARGIWRVFFEAGGIARIVILTIAPLIFEVYAFFRLFRSLGLNNLLLWLNLAGCTLLFFVGIASFVSYLIADD
jgi:hypothetical protein